MKKINLILTPFLILALTGIGVFQPAVPVSAAGTCALTAGQVLINEILPAATSGVDWVELYNTTDATLDVSDCYIDDISGGGGAPIQIAAGTTIPAHGFWTMDRSSYFNNGGDDVRLLLDDQATVLDSYTYPSTAYDVSWYRLPDGGAGVLGCKQLDYLVISHFHLDHIGYVGYGGLWHLVEVQGFTIGQSLLRDYNTYMGTTSGTFENWQPYIEGEGAAKLNPVQAVEGTSQVDLGGGVVFKIVTLDGNGAIIPGDFSADPTPPAENDYSIGAVISYGAFDEWIGGDLDGQYYLSEFGYIYHDIELSVAPEVGDVDVYRVNHHGSDHSNNPTFINQLDPEVSIISVGDDNTYGHPRQPVMDLLLATSDVYLT
ncbi:MAG: lamin tail domain-containing protein, partial [Chloroflexi bacterium]|nr:lamin tail domain-containing protein [Chloroflexota bacterium]